MKKIWIVIILLVLLGLLFLSIYTYKGNGSKYVIIGDTSLTLDREGFLCGKECDMILECASYNDFCTHDVSAVLLSRVKQIKEIYIESEDTFVIVVPKGTNLSGKWAYKELNNVTPKREDIDNKIRDHYGYFKPYKVNLVVEYK